MASQIRAVQRTQLGNGFAEWAGEIMQMVARAYRSRKFASRSGSLHAKIVRMGAVGIAAGCAGAVAVAAGAAAWSAMAPSSQIFGPTIRNTQDSGAIALTFDDGPNPAVTPALLEVLEQNDVRATFFVLGKFVRALPELALEIVARGHTIANHTETHPRLAFLPATKVREELMQCRDAIASATTRDTEWMRPPFGFRGPNLNSVVREMGFGGVVMWSRWAWDWKPQPAGPVIRRLRRVQGGDIVLLHDGDHRRVDGDRQHTVTAMEYWLPRWRDAGMRFVTLNDWKRKS
jgi:peptidoglycan/xylan/chitin deacetylase (PgdA/CDA1 family)